MVVPTQEKQPQQSPPQPQPQQQTDLNCEAFTNALTSSMMFGNGHGATRPRLPLPTTMTKSTLSPTKEGGFMPKEPKKIPTLPSTLRRQTPSPSGWSPGSGKAQNLSVIIQVQGSEERYAVAPSSAALEMTPYDLNRPEPPISPTPVQRIEPTPPPRPSSSPSSSPCVAAAATRRRRRSTTTPAAAKTKAETQAKTDSYSSTPTSSGARTRTRGA